MDFDCNPRSKHCPNARTGLAPITATEVGPICKEPGSGKFLRSPIGRLVSLIKHMVGVALEKSPSRVRKSSDSPDRLSNATESRYRGSNATKVALESSNATKVALERL